MSTSSVSRGELLLGAVIVEGGLGGLACLVGLLLGHPPWQSFHWEPMAVFRGVVATLPMVGWFFLCLWWPIGPLRSLKEFADRVIRPLFSQCSVLDLAFISLLAGVGEEFLFRGVLLPVLVQWAGSVWIGILLASVTFGLLHPMTVAYFVLTSLVGIYLGVVTYYFGNVLDVIVVHALYDFLALVVLVKFSKPSQNNE